MTNDQLNIAELQKLSSDTPELRKLLRQIGNWHSPYTPDEISDQVVQHVDALIRAAQAPLVERIKELEKQNAELRDALEPLVPILRKEAEGSKARGFTGSAAIKRYKKAASALASSQGEQNG